MRKKISIPKPCHQMLLHHPEIIGGNYCAHCTKIVKDFRQMQDHEILEYFKTYRGELCGIFKQNQLDRELKPAPLIDLSMVRRGIATSAISGLLSVGQLPAQMALPVQT